MYLCLHRYRDLIGLRCLVLLLIWLRSEHGRLYGGPAARTKRFNDSCRGADGTCGREWPRRLIAHARAGRSLRLLTQNWRRMGQDGRRSRHGQGRLRLKGLQGSGTNGALGTLVSDWLYLRTRVDLTCA